ncbi:glucokinase [Thalassobacillus devorans]|uniref:Glucokinase n=1 Tax=Thalassobacillus devorans TaxID=279813 RepID=A0ABQ1P8W9_9BACI|nr:ROK family glucokinase [Thalassobacillus devorans]NIK29642.1 glucokinase [Thalassobacillus devorans]GGC91693.1 glucokinase [Thalassobacillus devorans]
MQKYYIGADIGGTTIKMAVITEQGSIHDKWEIPTNHEDNGERIPEEITVSLKEKLPQLNIRMSQVLGLGAGAPGFVDTEMGFVYQTVNIGWKDFDLAKILNKKTGLPIFVDNDANLAALGEKWKGSGEDADNLIAVTLGTGVGGGIVANGTVINGANGTGGEIGHITVIPSGGASCNCGKTGCLETIASATGIVRLAKEAIKRNPDSILSNYFSPDDPLTAKEVFDAAAEGDKEAKEVLAYVTDILGMTIANLAIACNPSKIVIGGGVSKAGEKLLIPLRETFDKYALPRTSEACEFAIAELGNDAGVIGGAFLVKQNI